MKGIRDIAPYVAGAQPNFPDMIKINTNENPYPPSPKVEKALREFPVEKLALYSSLTNQPLKDALSARYGVSQDHFVIGNGSDEILAFAMMAFFNSEDPLLFPDATYGFYPVWADLFKIPYKEIPLNENFEVNLEDYSIPNGGIILPNPNAPTGLYRKQDWIIQLLENNPDVVVIIDEAYIDFGGETLIPLVDSYPNLVVVHTLSKSRSLAGLRVGYAVSNPKLIGILNAVKDSFNPYSVDMIAETLATAAVEDAPFYQKINKQICETRDWFTGELAKLGFETLPSLTNFVFTTHPAIVAADLFHYLQSKHIFVRHFNKPQRIQDFLRISIGTQEEMETTLKEIKNFLNK